MSITLKQANTIIDAILKRAAELNCRPISAVVVARHVRRPPG